MINVHQVENLEQKGFEVKLGTDVHKTPCFDLRVSPKDITQTNVISVWVCWTSVKFDLTLRMHLLVGDHSLNRELYQTILKDTHSVVTLEWFLSRMRLALCFTILLSCWRVAIVFFHCVLRLGVCRNQVSTFEYISSRRAEVRVAVLCFHCLLRLGVCGNQISTFEHISSRRASNLDPLHLRSHIRGVCKHHYFEHFRINPS